MCRPAVTETFLSFSAADPCRAAAGQHAHAVARTEVLVGGLGDGDQLAVVEPHGDFQPGLARDALLDGAACHAAGNGAEGVYEVLFGGDPACVSPSDVPWLSLDSTSGTTVPAATSTVTVTLDSTGLEGGTDHHANLCVESNDADTPLVVVPVTLHVDPMPFLDGFETGDTSRWSSSVEARLVGLAGQLAAQSLTHD